MPVTARLSKHFYDGSANRSPTSRWSGSNEGRIEKRFAEQDARIAQQFAAQTRFLYVSLVAQLGLIAGLYLR